MGRLDNAMRRAAGEAVTKSGVGTLDAQDKLPDEFPSEVEEAPFQAEAASEPEPEPEVSSAISSLSLSAPGADPGPVVSVPDPTLFKHIDTRLGSKTVVDDQMAPASREQYRRLAAALHQAQRANGFKVVMVASAVAGEGKSLTASNLALTLSESYRRNVLLIDGDLRRPSLHVVFQVEGTPGLSDGLISPDEPKLPLHRISPRLTVLPAGRPTSDPIGALTSSRMRRLVEEARDVFDWVIIDTPPVGILTDAALLSSMADGVVLVVKAESTSCDMVNRAVESIGRERVMGVVLNRAREQAFRTSYDYYKYYTAGELTSGSKS